jgi:hypothetical protein
MNPRFQRGGKKRDHFGISLRKYADAFRIHIRTRG